tara:strand:+ start:326 stop:466 length:141 start_codon:yes stop_codon:yes gene_type:complete
MACSAFLYVRDDPAIGIIFLLTIYFTVKIKKLAIMPNNIAKKNIKE